MENARACADAHPSLSARQENTPQILSSGIVEAHAAIPKEIRPTLRIATLLSERRREHASRLQRSPYPSMVCSPRRGPSVEAGDAGQWYETRRRRRDSNPW